MYVEPSDLDRTEVATVLGERWGLHVASLRYEPVGFGSHHYVAVDSSDAAWFVTVDELVASWISETDAGAYDALERAMRATLALSRGGLEFVHPPAPALDGSVTCRVGPRYAMSVFRFLEGATSPDADNQSVEERRMVLEALGRLHAAGVALVGGVARRDTLFLPDRPRLEAALGDLASPWTGGPYSERAWRLVRESGAAIRRLLARYDELAAQVAASADGWVVTHGEPHHGNLMRRGSGEVVLIDWGTVAMAPRERDLWQVRPRDDEDWAAYTRAAPAPPLDPAALELYELWWSLAEIGGYSHVFRQPHNDDADTREAWLNLQTFVPSPGTLE